MGLIRGIKVKRLKTAGEVIDSVGGTGAAATMVRASVASVSNWRRSGRLPPRTFLLFLQGLEAVGAMAPSTLWGIDPPGMPAAGMGGAL